MINQTGDRPVAAAADAQAKVDEPNVMHIEKYASRLVWIAAILVAFFCYLSVFTPVPTLSSPYSLMVIFPLFLLSDLGSSHFPGALIYLLGCTPLVGVFLLWSSHLRAASNAIPRRSIVLFLLFAFLSCVFLYGSWSYGVRWQGLQHTLIVVSINVIFIVSLFFLLFAARQRQTFATNYAFHVLLFIWLAWYAFPWLGELL